MPATRIFMNRWFTRYVRKQRITAAMLCEVIERAEGGVVDADLGSGLIKQRLARPGAGRSGGYRTLIAFRSGDMAVFLFGFAKSGQDNLELDELTNYLKLSVELLGLDDGQIAELVALGRWKLVDCVN